MNYVGSKQAALTRCPACQLQLCKSREALPHAALRVADGDIARPSKFNKEQHALYQCETCSTILVHSLDAMEPGWRQPR